MASEGSLKNEYYYYYYFNKNKKKSEKMNVFKQEKSLVSVHRGITVKPKSQ